MEPMYSETFFAACKSGEPTRPTEHECHWGHQADRLSFDSTLLDENFLARAEVIEESNPPDNNTPYGTSLINCRCTASERASCKSLMLVLLFF